ncbi:unnamed protein product [Mytilus edulis]|uniref:B box-type domain-containing protein n=1 Tax=Mytilus edulis TaxID=6550 RepID=A0A8S3TKS2_MYTED|nr:unnamed protein product [Mytilus edulis]
MSDSTVMCGVCCLRHFSKPSPGWYLECEVGLCWDCKEHHSLLKATRNHNIIPITEYQKVPLNVKCDIETHNNCKDLIEKEKNYITDVKCSARFQEVEEMLNGTAENIKRIRINRQENLTSLEEERKKIQNNIIQTRIKINNHLDKLQADLIQNINAKVAKENEKIQKVLKTLGKAVLDKRISKYF